MEPRAAKAEQALAAALDAIDREVENAMAAIKAGADGQWAFEEATKLSSVLRAYSDTVAELRALMVARIWKEDELTLSGLAKRISVSRARADQLLQQAKKNQPKED